MPRRPPAPKERPLSLAVAAPRLIVRPAAAAPDRVTQGEDVFMIGLFVLLLLGMAAVVYAFATL